MDAFNQNSFNAQDSLDLLIGQNVITWGCIKGWYRLANYQNQNSAYVPAVHQLCKCGFQPIRVMKIGITHLTHVSPKHTQRSSVANINDDVPSL